MSFEWPKQIINLLENLLPGIKCFFNNINLVLFKLSSILITFLIYLFLARQTLSAKLYCFFLLDIEKIVCFPGDLTISHFSEWSCIQALLLGTILLNLLHALICAHLGKKSFFQLFFVLTKIFRLHLAFPTHIIKVI